MEAVTTYTLNGLGQRIHKTGTDVAIQETVYLGEHSPWSSSPPPPRNNLHADHLNTPRVITDNTNKVI